MAILDEFGIGSVEGVCVRWDHTVVQTDTCRFELPLIIYSYLMKEGIKKNQRHQNFAIMYFQLHLSQTDLHSSCTDQMRAPVYLPIIFQLLIRISQEQLAVVICDLWFVLELIRIIRAEEAFSSSFCHWKDIIVWSP